MSEEIERRLADIATELEKIRIALERIARKIG